MPKARYACGILPSFLSGLSFKFWDLSSTSFRALVSLSSPRLPPFLTHWVSFTYFVLCPWTGLSFHQWSKNKTPSLCWLVCHNNPFVYLTTVFQKISLLFPVPKWWSPGIIMRWIEFLFLPVMNYVTWSRHIISLSLLICKVILTIRCLNYFK